MPKILHLFFGCGDPSYRVEIAAPRPVRVHIDATKVAEDDMRRVIDQDVVMGCYRAADERGMECSKWATSIVFQGRELAK